MQPISISDTAHSMVVGGGAVFELGSLGMWLQAVDLNVLAEGLGTQSIEDEYLSLLTFKS